MSRPLKNGLDYFSHDNSMRNDRKIKALRTKFGLEGYAIYNMLLETLCEADLLILNWNATEIELISGDFNLVSDRLTIVSAYLFEIGLLKIVNGYLFCPKLDERAEGVFRKRTKLLNDLRAEKGIFVLETPISDKETPHTLPEIPQRKEKKRKEKNNIYCSEFSNSEQLTPHGKITIEFWKLFKKITLEAGSKTTILDKAKIDEWEQSIKAMIEKEEISEKELRKVYVWLNERKTKDAIFWAKNIKSTAKLREKLPIILEQMNSEHSSDKFPCGLSLKQPETCTPNDKHRCKFKCDQKVLKSEAKQFRKAVYPGTIRKTSSGMISDLINKQ